MQKLERKTLALDDAAQSERLATLASIGRADGGHCALLLRSLLAERTTRLRALCVALAAGGGDGGAGGQSGQSGPLLEELTLLVRLGAHLLADAGNGEAPEPPRSLAAVKVPSASEHPVAAFVGALCDLLALEDELVLASARAHAETNAVAVAWRAAQFDDVVGGAGGVVGGAVSGGAFAEALSPRLAEALLWALERLAPTYLLRPTDEVLGCQSELMRLSGVQRKDA
ncbi:hypothetical protein T492DRAFT_844826 [Pavlovales sp. CCMP2436]|nr:hypothetical protein T492DRAFT_844826 [Pavlovales sp. CCMP2436]